MANKPEQPQAQPQAVEPLVTAQAEACTELFCPIYSLAVTPDPLLVAANQTARPDIFMAGGWAGAG